MMDGWLDVRMVCWIETKYDVETVIHDDPTSLMSME